MPKIVFTDGYEISIANPVPGEYSTFYRGCVAWKGSDGKFNSLWDGEKVDPAGNRWVISRENQTLRIFHSNNVLWLDYNFSQTNPPAEAAFLLTLYYPYNPDTNIYYALYGANANNPWLFVDGVNSRGENFEESTSTSYKLYISYRGIIWYYTEGRPLLGGVANWDTFGVSEGEVPPPPEPPPYDPGGTSNTGGGTGNFDGSSDNIDIPSLPTLSAVDTGFITIYNPTASQLLELSQYMWSDLFSLDTLKKLFADPMDVILGLSIVPVNVPSGSVKELKIGNISTGISLTPASTQYVEVDCGSLNVNEYWGGYLDYNPYTKCQIFLPYIGIKSLSADDVMNKTVKLVYHIDILSGVCVAFIKCGGSVLYQFTGQVSSMIPISANNFEGVIQGALSLFSSVGNMVAKGVSGGYSAGDGIKHKKAFTVGELVGDVGSSAQAVTQMKESFNRTDSMSSTGGLLGIQIPYLILERPRQCIPSDQPFLQGYPSYITRQLGDVHGYTVVEHVHLEGIPCTSDELTQIEGILHSGVIF